MKDGRDNPVDQIVAAGGGGSASQKAQRMPSGVAETGVGSAVSLAASPRRDSVEISTAAVEAARAQAAPAAPKPSASEPKENGSVSIHFNKDLGIMQAKVVDPVTHQVIREIPPDEVLKMAARIRTFFKERDSAPRRDGEATELLGSREHGGRQHA